MPYASVGFGLVVIWLFLKKYRKPKPLAEIGPVGDWTTRRSKNTRTRSKKTCQPGVKAIENCPLIIAITCVIAIAVIAFILGVRPKDLPEPEPESPFAHLDERKAAIYENLRDLQFEYRVGKLSDEDYQTPRKTCKRNWPESWPKSTA